MFDYFGEENYDGRGFRRMFKIGKMLWTCQAKKKKKKIRTFNFCEKYWSDSIHNFQAPPPYKNHIVAPLKKMKWINNDEIYKTAIFTFTV